ncbi:MAG: tRNA adenosine(34) deaminase TadA, partial [Caldimonas sp.]
SVIDVFGNAILNHHSEIVGGVLAEASAEVLRSFFVERREQYRQRRAAPTAPVPIDEPAPSIPAGESLEIDAEPER